MIKYFAKVEFIFSGLIGNFGVGKLEKFFDFFFMANP
jgi:hypothetical protein